MAAEQPLAFKTCRAGGGSLPRRIGIYFFDALTFAHRALAAAAILAFVAALILYFFFAGALVVGFVGNASRPWSCFSNDWI
jgi:hypothetical protein